MPYSKDNPVVVISSVSRLLAHEKPDELCLGVNLATIWAKQPDDGLTDAQWLDPLKIWHAAEPTGFHLFLQDTKGALTDAGVYPCAEGLPAANAAGIEDVKLRLDASLATMAVAARKDRALRDLFRWQGSVETEVARRADDPTQPAYVSVDHQIAHLSTQPAVVSGPLNLSFVVRVKLNDLGVADPVERAKIKTTGWCVLVVPEIESKQNGPFPSAVAPVRNSNEWEKPDVFLSFDYAGEADEKHPRGVCFAQRLFLTTTPATGTIDPATMWIKPPATGATWSDHDWLAELPGRLVDTFDPLGILLDALEDPAGVVHDQQGVPPANLPPLPESDDLRKLLIFATYLSFQDQWRNASGTAWTWTYAELPGVVDAGENGVTWPNEEGLKQWRDLARDVVGPADLLGAAQTPEEIKQKTPRSDPPATPRELAGQAQALAALLRDDVALRALTAASWARLISPDDDAVQRRRAAALAAGLANTILGKRIARDRVEHKSASAVRAPATRPTTRPATLPTTGPTTRPTTVPGEPPVVSMAIWRKILHDVQRNQDAGQPELARTVARDTLSEELNAFWNARVDAAPVSATAKDWARPAGAEVIRRRAENVVDKLFPNLADRDVFEESVADRPGTSPIVLQLDSTEDHQTSDDLFRQYAGLGVMLRRAGSAETDDTLGHTDWACLNMARLEAIDLLTDAEIARAATRPATMPATRPTDVAAADEVVAPYRVGYDNGVRAALVSYDNAPLVARSHVADATPDKFVSTAGDAPPRAPGQDWTLQAVALDADTMPWAKLPALLFGFRYEALPFVIGNSGALPKALNGKEGAHPATLGAYEDVEGNLETLATAKQAWELRYFRRTPVSVPRLDAAAVTPERVRDGVSPGFTVVPTGLRTLAADVVGAAAPSRPTTRPAASSLPTTRSVTPGPNDAAVKAAAAGGEAVVLLAPEAGNGYCTSAEFVIRPPTVDLATWDRWFGADIALETDTTKKNRLITTRTDVWQAFYAAASFPQEKGKADPRLLDDPAVFVPGGKVHGAATVSWTRVYPPVPSQTKPVEEPFVFTGSERVIGLAIGRRDDGVGQSAMTGQLTGRLNLALPAGVWRIEVSCPIDEKYCAVAGQRRFAKMVFADGAPYRSAVRTFYVEVVPALTRLHDDRVKALLAAAAEPLKQRAASDNADDWKTAFELGRVTPNTFARFNLGDGPLALEPDPDELWGRLAATFESDHVRLSLHLPDPSVNPAFAYVTAAEVQYQLWRWNGQPVKPFPAWPAAGKPAQLDPDITAAGATLTPAMAWEVEAFSDRLDADAQTEMCQLPFRGGPVTLLDRSFTGDPRARYVRLSARVFPRYPGMPGADFPPVAAAMVYPRDDASYLNTPWRRLLVPPRPDSPLPAPPVRLVVPLTHGYQAPAGAGSPVPSHHAVLVVIDDAWFDKAGIAEELVGRIATTTTGRNEVGPDPLVSVDTAYSSRVRDVKEVAGPVGHTFDTTALAPRIVASSFVVTVDGASAAIDDQDHVSQDWLFAKLQFQRRIAVPLPGVDAVLTDSPLTDPVWVQFVPGADDTPVKGVGLTMPLLEQQTTDGRYALAKYVLEMADAGGRLEVDGQRGFEWWALVTRVSAGAAAFGRAESYVAVVPLRDPAAAGSGTGTPVLANIAAERLLVRLLRVQTTRVAGQMQPLVLASVSAETTRSHGLIDTHFWDALFGTPGDAARAENDARGRIVSVSSPRPGTPGAVQWLNTIREYELDQANAPPVPATTPATTAPATAPR